MAKTGETMNAVIPACPPRAPGELWRIAAEASEDAVFGLDPDGMVLSWNRSAVRLLGYAPEEIVGCPTTSLVPDDQAEAQERRSHGRRAVSQSTRSYSRAGRIKFGLGDRHVPRRRPADGAHHRRPWT
ncbi:MAG: PAS domain S-box protein [Acidimicrobiia bacterium]|nr:PAS domain S-box protein [Acidimicrobiia bacterium]